MQRVSLSARPVVGLDSVVLGGGVPLGLVEAGTLEGDKQYWARYSHRKLLEGAASAGTEQWRAQKTQGGLASEDPTPISRSCGH